MSEQTETHKGFWWNMEGVNIYGDNINMDITKSRIEKYGMD